MQRATITAILLSALLVVTQPPVFFALWYGVPVGYLLTLGLMFLVIEMAGELKRVIRQDDEAEEEISLAS